MRKSGTPTKYPGVKKLGNKKYRVRGKAIDPRTGKSKEVDRVLNNVTAQQAARKREELLDEVRAAGQTNQRMRVGEYAQLWMKSKALKLDSATANHYAAVLERHILPAFGEFYYDALTRHDVQAWVDQALTSGWKTRSGKPRTYALRTVEGWYWVLRSMTRDAIAELDLQRDPTFRVSFPEAPQRLESKALTAEQATKFLEAMREQYPQHFALTMMLAYTGLRFCHASALKWSDWDEDAGFVRIVRKQVRGKVGPLTRKKQAPREYPIEPELAAVLRWQRERMVALQAPGLAEGWMFPTSTGTLRQPHSLGHMWQRCMERIRIDKHFTVHGMRYTFTDLVRQANVDAVVRRALTGHVTEEMQHHYSSVGLAEKRAAVAGVHRLVPIGELLVDDSQPADSKVGTDVGTNVVEYDDRPSPRP